MEKLNRHQSAIVRKILREFRKIDPQMPMQQAALLVELATHPVCTMSELTRRLEISQSSVSRNVAALSKVDRHQKPGLDLVESVEDPAERRRKIVSLTPKGHELMSAVLASVERSVLSEELEWLRLREQLSDEDRAMIRRMMSALVTPSFA